MSNGTYITKEDFAKRIAQLDNADFNHLSAMYWRAIKHERYVEAGVLGQVIFHRFGVGDFRSGSDYGNE